MPKAELIHHSPLSQANASSHAPLLLQFLLSEMIQAYHSSSKEALVGESPSFFPYDWSLKSGHLTKLQEYTSLLKHAFPDLTQECKAFAQGVKKVGGSFKHVHQHVQHMWHLMEPFLITCKNSDTLLLFLIEQHKNLKPLLHPSDLMSLLLKLHPEGLGAIYELIHASAHKKGQTKIASSLKSLFEQLKP